MLPDVNNDQSLKINYEDLIQTHEVVERRPPKMSRISSIRYYLGGGFKYSQIFLVLVLPALYERAG